MDYSEIQFSIQDNLALLTLNRPAKRNALTAQMRLEITHAIRHASDHARCLVITGAGDAFCSGQDLSTADSRGRMDLERVLRDEYTPMLEALAQCPVPTLAAVNGAAAGAGANLALACDVVVASEAAYFTQAFTKIGLMPDAGGTWTLPRQIGQAKAMGAALFAEPISATDASAMGMIWEAVPERDFVDQWRARAKHLSEGPTRAYSAIKTALRKSQQNSFDAQMDYEATLQGQLGHTRDFLEGVTAFQEKRPAKFEGR
ncbi:enoyl-CoA hydratase-related protein [Epibacterium ulvae]|uniref:enoyl-CoA hydratase-related protein n=1 Tax=Epibacterium ulvae TaxID=1156985 RepID=UPI002493BC0D|nr:enoyl-CoA hydratase-related protein [Epibacterium ulvae]